MIEYTREWEFSDPYLQTVKVCQCPDGQFGLGSTVWDAALVLAGFLDSPTGSRLIKGSVCVELGAGTGIVSIVAASLGAKSCVATDRSDMVPFINQNIGMNAQIENCRAVAWDWSDPVVPPECVPCDWALCSDCVYESETAEAFISSLKRLNPTKGIILSNERREAEVNSAAEESVFKALAREGFRGLRMKNDQIPEQWRCDDIDIWVLVPPELEDPNEAVEDCPDLVAFEPSVGKSKK